MSRSTYWFLILHPNYIDMVLLVELPTEVILRILTYVFIPDIFSVQLISRFFQTLVSDSINLRYQILLQASGMLDNPRTDLPVRSRYEMLKEREKAWFLVQPRFTKTIPVDHPTVEINGPWRSIYLISDDTRRVIDSIALPSNASDPVSSWKRLRIEDLDSHEGHTRRKILDFGVAEDLDLLAIITSDTPDDIRTIRVNWIQHSTSRIHPRAGPAMSLTFDDPFVCAGVDIVGSLVAVTLQSHQRGRPGNRVMVLDWTKGATVAEFRSSLCRYINARFIAQDVLLVPNSGDSSIELWIIPTSDSDLSQPSLKTTPDLALNLPSIRADVMVEEFACRGAPSPSMESSPSQRAFSSDPEHSILIFHLFVRVQFVQRPVPVVFFARRKMFMELLRTYDGLPPSEREQARAGEHTNVLPLHVIPWIFWGPTNTRFFCQTTDADWITTSGQRYVFFDHRGEGFPLVIFDFNENTVKRVRDAVHKARTQDPPGHSLHIPLLDVSAPFLSQGPGGMERPRIGWSWRFSEKLPWNNRLLERIFAEPVHGSLPYVMSCSEVDYDFDGVMMDDERILGVRRGDFSASGGVDRLEAMWFG
ncbi:hypothetical protein D9758_007883 [Tetrapyrgos nigripes]|uniref:F-box domain-containing protein n=1 Tax=Tetrapyrgos nigripes TaxID=182062 RepID=A0A8H5D3D8_9AGAR|nr:hypothetical protein D9758_007883 [Tetrapyrgos nigripes]